MKDFLMFSTLLLEICLYLFFFSYNKSILLYVLLVSPVTPSVRLLFHCWTAKFYFGQFHLHDMNAIGLHVTLKQSQCNHIRVVAWHSFIWLTGIGVIKYLFPTFIIDCLYCWNNVHVFGRSWMRQIGCWMMILRKHLMIFWMLFLVIGTHICFLQPWPKRYVLKLKIFKCIHKKHFLRIPFSIWLH